MKYHWSHLIQPLKIVSASFLALALFLLTPVTTMAAEFRSDETLTVAERTENLYAAGQTVTISAPVDKDLVVAGETVRVENGVERNINAAGRTVTIDSTFVGANVRAAGETVTIRGTINEDLIVAASVVDIQDATINGDLIIAGSDVTVLNSEIGGAVYGSYAELTGDLQTQAEGSVMINEIENEEAKPMQQSLIDRINLPWEFSVIVTIVVISLLLQSRGRLDIPSLGFNKQFLIDILIGLAVMAALPFALILSVFVFLFPIVIPLVIMTLMGLILVLMILPIYIANLIKHSFQLQADIRVLIGIVYVTLFLINLIPGLQILNVVVAIIALGAVGFLTRADMRALSHYLEPRGSKARKHKKK